MNTRGHNENAVRLSMLADDAKAGLDRVESGEVEAITGWLAYGAALNEGRSLFPGDREFGQWLEENHLNRLETSKLKREAHAGGSSSKVGKGEVHPEERSASMWAAANIDQFESARADCEARTIRGIFGHHKKIAAAREKAAQEAAEQAERERLAAEAKEAKRLADEKAKAEKAAQAAVAKAQTDEDREKAEAKAEEAAAEKAEAVKAAAQAEAAAKQAAPKEAPPDPDAKARKELSKLTPDALIDEVIGLRADLAEAKAKAKEQAAEIEALKADIAAFKEDDMGRSLGNAQRQARSAEGRMKEYQAIAVRADKRVKILETENKKLRAEIENTIIPMGPQ